MSDDALLPERSRVVRRHLSEAGIEVAIRVLPDSARTAVEAAAAVGCDVAAIANSLVFLADGEPVLVMTSGGHRADLAVLATSIGAAEVSMAPASVVRAATGQAIGGVAPSDTRPRCAPTSMTRFRITARCGRPPGTRTPSCR
ncbi:YbaK/EbsC family protein [Microbacterium sp. Se5.02b]|uniref:YbaK/EbsC family protein n=1 Tax=Microbacterium sp. Se5.02b TaxID=2864103 RepID=UPI002867EC2D|nr:YbaK/EbsC family protein [Microbacterium sp. Se5.02b]